MPQTDNNEAFLVVTPRSRSFDFIASRTAHLPSFFDGSPYLVLLGGRLTVLGQSLEKYEHSAILSAGRTSVIPYPETLSLFFPGRPCCDKAQQNGRKKGRNEQKYCCTIPFIKFALFRLHLDRLNKLNKIIYPKLIFSKCFKLSTNYFLKCLRIGFYWNIVLRCAMYSAVRN